MIFASIWLILGDIRVKLESENATRVRKLTQLTRVTRLELQTLAGRPTDSLIESVGKPADSLPSHFIGAASGMYFEVGKRLGSSGCSDVIFSEIQSSLSANEVKLFHLPHCDSLLQLRPNSG